MFAPNLPLHQGLFSRSRLRARAAPRGQTQLWELAWLVAMGAAAASAATFWDWSLRIPGHAILRTVFPMTLGLALVPRHGAGFVMGTFAIGTTAVYAVAGLGLPGLGALTSLAVFGPVLDAVLWRAQPGWRLFGGFAAAGVFSNVIALAVRGGGRLAGAGRLASGPGRSGDLAVATADTWWIYAPISYAVCGLLAGLLCAAMWFAVRPPRATP